MSDRRGFGFVVGLALLFVAVFSLIALALGQFESEVAGEVRAGDDVLRGRVLAQAALEELFFQLSVRVNDRGDPLFGEFHQGVHDHANGPRWSGPRALRRWPKPGWVAG